MPLIEINGELHSVTRSQKILKSSCWRKVAGVVGFIQLTSYLLVTLVLLSGTVIQTYTGAAPYHYEILDTIRSGILVRCLHRDIMEAHNFGVSAIARNIVEETVEDGMGEINDLTMSTDLKTELEEADWGTVFTIYVFATMIVANQCWRGAQLLRASLKWQNPTRALELMHSWSSSVTSYRNYLVGVTVSTLLFGSEVPGLSIFILTGVWLITCVISALAHRYYAELSTAELHRDEEEII